MGFFERNFRGAGHSSWDKQAQRQAKIKRETERGRKDKKAEKLRAAARARGKK